MLGYILCDISSFNLMEDENLKLIDFEEVIKINEK